MNKAEKSAAPTTQSMCSMTTSGHTTSMCLCAPDLLLRRTFISAELAHLIFHELAGLLMMVLALGIMWLELRVLSWVFPTREVQDGTGVAKRSMAPASAWGLPTSVRAAGRS